MKFDRSVNLNSGSVHSLSTHTATDADLGFSPDQRNASDYFGWQKRTFDVAITVLFSPFIIVGVLLVAIAIKATTNGPVFFRQSRNGKDMKPFTILKFQTYTENLDPAILESNSGAENLTRIGRILRKTSLDELPNFYNVLAGDMSLVGARPHVLTQDATIADSLPDWNKRYKQLPGITGLAQVEGEAGPMVDIDQCANRLRYDLEYFTHASVLYDCKLMFKTIYRAVRRDRS